MLFNFQIFCLFITFITLKSFPIILSFPPNSLFKTVCDVAPDLVSFVKLEKREKQPWKSVTFSKVAG